MFSAGTFADDKQSEACEGFGPQTPRNIDSQAGGDKRVFGAASDSSEVNLCHIHFHENAEYKVTVFSIYTGDRQRVTNPKLLLDIK
ncbi:MAG: hypothetical protein L3J62_10230 [Gammaproteobacteria bacterium]|nr:hypothetical protein [Gammaproteobacteria bacterium]MCF6231141.1 hypothetical protein [Gammaproteobacteria bacterium]